MTYPEEIINFVLDKVVPERRIPRGTRDALFVEAAEETNAAFPDYYRPLGEKAVRYIYTRYGSDPTYGNRRAMIVYPAAGTTDDETDTPDLTPTARRAVKTVSKGKGKNTLCEACGGLGVVPLEAAETPTRLKRRPAPSTSRRGGNSSRPLYTSQETGGGVPNSLQANLQPVFAGAPMTLQNRAQYPPVAPSGSNFTRGGGINYGSSQQTSCVPGSLGVQVEGESGPSATYAMTQPGFGRPNLRMASNNDQFPSSAISGGGPYQAAPYTQPPSQNVAGTAGSRAAANTRAQKRPAAEIQGEDDPQMGRGPSVEPQPKRAKTAATNYPTAADNGEDLETGLENYSFLADIGSVPDIDTLWLNSSPVDPSAGPSDNQMEAGPSAPVATAESAFPLADELLLDMLDFDA
ncbi:hypothetical protein AAE478_009688 [Parahypoxylon ruwenzoriense]